MLPLLLMSLNTLAHEEDTVEGRLSTEYELLQGCCCHNVTGGALEY